MECIWETARRERYDVRISLEQMPDWPGRMTAPIAAAYMGISHTTFLDRFRSVGVKEGGSVFWARAQLDRIIGEQFGIDVLGNPIEETPAMAYDWWKAEQDRR